MGKRKPTLKGRATRLSTDAYDNDGNTTVSGGTTNTYDFENRMLTHGSLSLVYDGDGNRVSETVGGTTTKFLVDDLNPTGLPQVLDEISGTVMRTYSYGLQRISENQLISGIWTPSFYGYDGHGSTRFLSNTAGSVTDAYDYDTFGMPIRSSGPTSNNYLYSGERFDSSAVLYDLRARYYNQTTGRFWARDPVEGRKCCGLSWNPYIYVRDNPTNNSDPTGREVLILYLQEAYNDLYQASYIDRPIGQCISATFLAEGGLLNDYQNGIQVNPGANTQIVFNLENLFSNAASNLTGTSLPLSGPPLEGSQCQNPPSSSGNGSGVGSGSSGTGSGNGGGFGGGSSGGSGGTGSGSGGFGGGSSGGGGASGSY